jgi:hypothetical protein
LEYLQRNDATMKTRLFSFFSFLTLVAFLAPEASGQAVVVKKRNVETGEIYSSSSSKSNTNSSLNQAIKYNFLPFFIGEMPLGYEVKINDFLSAEAGLGITTNNSLDELLYSGYTDFYDLADRNLINLSHYASLKVFPEGNAFNDGYYLGFDYHYRPYSKGFTVDGATRRATKRFTDIGLVFGFQGRPSEHVMLDVYAGIAQRHINWDKPTLTQIIDPVSGNVVANLDITNDRYPTLGGLLGFKLSYLFGQSIIQGVSNDSSTASKAKTKKKRSKRRRRRRR